MKKYILGSLLFVMLHADTQDSQITAEYTDSQATEDTVILSQDDEPRIVDEWAELTANMMADDAEIAPCNLLLNVLDQYNAYGMDYETVESCIKPMIEKAIAGAGLFNVITLTPDQQSMLQRMLIHLHALDPDLCKKIIDQGGDLYVLFPSPTKEETKSFMGNLRNNAMQYIDGNSSI